MYNGSQHKVDLELMQTKTEKDPTCAIFLKSRHFEDIKYDSDRRCCDKVGKSESQNVRKSAVLPTSLMSFLVSEPIFN